MEADLFLGGMEVVKTSDCDLSRFSDPESLRGGQEAVFWQSCKATRFLLMSLRRPERLLSYTWVHFTILIVHFTPLENSMSANTWEKRHTNYP